MDTTGTIWMPEQASTIASEVDGMFYFIFYLSLFFMVTMYATIVYFGWKYRRKGKRDVMTSGPDQNHALEIAWTVIPTIIVLFLFYFGFSTYLKMTIVPKDAMEVTVVGQKWFWSVNYPGGATTVGELVVPVNKPIKIMLTSRDVLHGFFVPQFRVKIDAVPNRYQILWFEATRVGEFDLFCTEYCGRGHSEMLAKVKVLPMDEYEKWLADQSFDPDMPPEVLGEKLYTSKACYTCHTIDGTRTVGPTFLDAFGRAEPLEDGTTVTVDENYIRSSLLDPGSQVAKGYQPVMPTYQGLLKEREIEALIAYIKTLTTTSDATEVIDATDVTDTTEVIE